MDVRKRHNSAKFDLLKHYTKRGSTLLDVGSGRGGDIHKWNKLYLSVTACEPYEKFVHDMIGRINESKYLNVTLFHGDVRTAPMVQFDTISYMFSIHYIWAHDTQDQINALRARVKPGGFIIGTIPWGDRIQSQKEFMSPEGTFWLQDREVCWSVDGPFYNETVQKEPLVTKDMLVNALGDRFDLLQWEPLGPEGISPFYAKFAFYLRP